MKYIISLLAFFFLSFATFAQVNFVSRVEVPSDLYDPSFEMLRIDEGLVVFRTVPEKTLSFQLGLQLMQVDFELNTEAGLLEYAVRPGYDLLGYDYSDGDVFLLFQKGATLGSEKYIFKIDLETKKGFEFDASNLLDMRLLEFLVENDKAIFMGEAEGRPVIQIFDLEIKTVQTVQGIYGNDTQILQIQKLPLIDALQVVISRKGPYRSREILINTYDLLGNLLREIRVDQFGTEGEEILDGLLLPPYEYRQAMIGSYGQDRRDAYEGMYLMDINEFGEYQMNQYTLVDFPNFYNYLPEKQRDKRVDEVLKNEEKGKGTTIRDAYTIRSVSSDEEAYYIYFDHFDVVNNRSSNRNGPVQGRYYRADDLNRLGFNPFFNNLQDLRFQGSSLGTNISTEFRYISAHFIKLGREGNVIWDNSSTYSDFTTDFPMPFGEMAVVGQDVYHLFVKNLNIQMSYFKNGVKQFEDADFPIELVNEEERIRDTNANSLQLVHWYGPYFLLSGMQRVRFLDEEGKDQSREVFFMTKILVNGELYEEPTSED